MNVPLMRELISRGSDLKLFNHRAVMPDGFGAPANLKTRPRLEQALIMDKMKVNTQVTEDSNFVGRASLANYEAL